MKKIIFFLTLLIFLFAQPVSAKGKSDDAPLLPEIPEKEGIYKDPSDPTKRVRVLIHRQRQLTNNLLTCSDLDSSEPISASVWKLPTGSWRYNINVSSVPASVGSSNISTIAGLGFNEWESAQNSVTFVRGADTTVARSRNDGLNIIAWGKTSNAALAVTYGYYNPTTGIITDVDTLMNSNRQMKWSWTPYSQGSCGVANTYDAQAVLTHEQGHWLGADDEYTEQFIYHTMYGYGTTGDISSDTLTTGDKTGIGLYYQ